MRLHIPGLQRIAGATKICKPHYPPDADMFERVFVLENLVGCAIDDPCSLLCHRDLQVMYRTRQLLASPHTIAIASSLQRAKLVVSQNRVYTLMS